MNITSPQTLQQEAIDPATSPDRLQELVTRHPELCYWVAQNENAAPTLLVELAARGDRRTREKVASNPNTPPDKLFELGTQFPRQLLDNPVFGLLLLENPNLAEEMSVETLRSLVTQAEVPVAISQGAVSRRDRYISLALTKNPDTPKSILESLVRQVYPRVKEDAKLHINWIAQREETWGEIARKKVEKAFLEADPLPPHAVFSVRLLGWMAQSEDRELREIAASNPHLPAAIAEELVEDKVQNVREALAKKTTSQSLLHHLAREKAMHSSVAANPATHVSILTELSDRALSQMGSQQSWSLLGSIARHPHTSTEILEHILAKIKRPLTRQTLMLRWAIALHPRCPAQTRERLLGKDPLRLAQQQFDPSQLVRPGTSSYAILRQIAINPRTPQRVLLELAQQNLSLHLLVAQNPNIPPETLAHWAQQPRLQAAIAANPNVPPDLLEQWVEGNKKLREAVASNPNLSEDLAAVLIADTSEATGCQLADNPNLTSTRLTQLFEHRSTKVREKAMKNYSDRCSQDLSPVLSILAQGYSNRDRLIALFHPQTPGEILTQSARSLEWIERCAVAQNPNTPATELAHLREDGNWVVRTAAKENMALNS